MQYVLQTREEYHKALRKLEEQAQMLEMDYQLKRSDIHHTISMIKLELQLLSSMGK